MGKLAPLKMFAVPGLMLGLKVFGADYKDSATILVIRATFAVMSLVVLLAQLFVGLKLLTSKRQAEETVEVEQKDMQGNSTTTKLSVKDYDMAEWRKAIGGFLLVSAISVFAHVKFEMVPTLLISSVMQTLTLLESPLFRIYILEEAPASDDELKRPFVAKNPMKDM
eukprot:jgi/Chlat1/1551/Chrsp122S01807